MVTGVSSVAVRVSSIASGLSFCALTVMVAAAVVDVAPPLSVTLNGILTVPLKLSAGVKIKPAACAGVNAEFATTGVTPSARYSVPCVVSGNVSTRTATMVPSASLPLKLIAILLSSLPDGAIGLAVGASLIAVIGPRLSPPVSVKLPSDIV